MTARLTAPAEAFVTILPGWERRSNALTRMSAPRSTTWPGSIATRAATPRPRRSGKVSRSWATSPLDVRWAEGRSDRLPELVAELIRLKVDVLVSGDAAHARQARLAALRRLPAQGHDRAARTSQRHRLELLTPPLTVSKSGPASNYLIGSGRGTARDHPGASVAPPIAEGIAAPPNSSGSCHKPMNAVQQTTYSPCLLDHPISLGEQCARRIDAERLRVLEIDNESELGGFLDGQVGGLRALQDAVNVSRGPAK